MVFVNSFRLAWQPFFLSVKEDPGARAMFSRIATYYAMFIGMVFLGITLFREEIFSILAPKYPVYYAGLLPFGAVACVLFGFYLIMNAGVFIRDKTNVLPVATVVAAVINIGLNFLFIPRFGVYGAAFTSIVAYIAMVAILYSISRRIYRVDYELGRLAVVVLASAVPAIVPGLIMPDGHVAGFIFRGALLLVPPGVYIAGGFLRPDERQAWVKLRGMYFRKGRKNG
jgi:O-antigen/teichoic acid export membrane protein